VPVAIPEKYPYVFAVVIGNCKVQLAIFIEVSQSDSVREVRTARGDRWLECPVPVPEQHVKIGVGGQCQVHLSILIKISGYNEPGWAIGWVKDRRSEGAISIVEQHLSARRGSEICHGHI